MLLHGLDVSHHQGVIRWNLVAAAGMSFVYLKATQGAGYVDTRFAANVAGAQAAGLKVGAYHYLGEGDGAEEADHYLATLPEELELSPVLDFEEAPAGEARAATVARALAWMRRVEERCRRPLVYTFPFFAPLRCAEALALGGYGLWIAHPGVDAPHVPEAWAASAWRIWQHSHKGRVPGISGPVDLNCAVGWP